MIDFPTELKNLAGETLYTLSRYRPFDVLSVEPYEVEIYIRSSGKKRRVPRSEIEPAWQYLRRHGKLTRAEIREQWSEVNPAYVAAILAALPSVTYTSKPVICLYYQEGQ